MRTLVTRFGFATLAAAFAWLVAAPPVVFASEAVYTVSGVAVDETADSELAAKTAGLVNGKRDAWRRLMERLTLSGDADRAPQPGDAAIENLIRDLSIDDERFGGGRYLAELTVRFVPSAVRDVMRRAGLSYAETQSRPLVVLPLYQVAGVVMLWDDGNDWFDAWAGLELPESLVPLIVPLGDLSDVSTVSARQVLNEDRDAIAGMARKYGATGVFVAVAQDRTAPGGQPEVDVAVLAHAPGFEDWIEVVAFSAGPDGDISELLVRAAHGAVAAIDDRWKRDNLVRPDEAAETLRVRAPIDSLSHWLGIKRGLAGASPTVREVTLVELSTVMALVDIGYAGGLEQLQRTLSRQGLRLEPAPDGDGWTLLASRGE